MSVQAGIWNIDELPVSRQVLAKLSRELKPYGPDGETLYIHHCMGMLYRPFHTTPESRLEQQPLQFGRTKVITWDGRLDNRDELISQLLGDLTDDRSDVALVAAAFERWDSDCFPKLIGDWALAVWNPTEKSLILARDYIGVRRLYYHLTSKQVAWCSHLAPLVSASQRLSLCDEYIGRHFVLNMRSDLTPYNEIHLVPAGRFVRIQNGTATIHSYWSFNHKLKTQYKTDAEYEEHFRHLLRQAIRHRLRSASPILAELSGGFDSSAIVCTADILAQEDERIPQVDTFSYSFPDEPEGDDHLYFPEVEKSRTRSGHHAMVMGSGDSFSLQYPTPMPVPQIGARNEVECARREVVSRGKYRVVLSGFGGDEFLAQTLDPRVQMADLIAQLRLRPLVEQMKIWSLLIRRPWFRLFSETALLLFPSSIRVRTTRSAKVVPTINGRFARKYHLAKLQLLATEGSTLRLPSARDSLQTYMTIAGILANRDASLDETRYPYLDQVLTEFLMSIPKDQLLRPGQRRSLMRRALAGILPSTILSRTTKQCEGRCYAVTLAKHWEAIKEIIASPLSSALGYVNQPDLGRALTAMKHGNVSGESMVALRCLFFELWLRDKANRGWLSIATYPTERPTFVVTNQGFRNAHAKVSRARAYILASSSLLPVE